VAVVAGNFGQALAYAAGRGHACIACLSSSGIQTERIETIADERF
jgi:hypothetical protein